LTRLFIASRFIPHDGSRRVVMAGSITGYSLRVRGPLGGADALATAVIAGRQQREAAETAARGKL
jgi:hypothetical protein